jgi:cytochrome b561
MPKWQVKLARRSHLLLYGLMITMPLTGFFGAMLDEYGVALFGMPLPAWLHLNKALSDKLFMIHGYVAWALVTVIAIHILAALKHLLINKDGVFQRMWFGARNQLD